MEGAAAPLIKCLVLSDSRDILNQISRFVFSHFSPRELIISPLPQFGSSMSVGGEPRVSKDHLCGQRAGSHVSVPRGDGSTHN